MTGSIQKYFILILSFMLLPGCCSQYVRWGHQIANQGTTLSEYTEITNNYIRSTRIYDQFITLGIFDAIWLSDEVLQAYVDTYRQKRCLSYEQYSTMLADQMAVNESFITFYLLASYPGQDKKPLDEDDPYWEIQLQINGHCYSPVEVKSFELPLEYRTFFGIRYNLFKTAYIVRFNAKNAYGSPILQWPVCMKLVLRRVQKQTVMCWDIGPSGTTQAPCYFDQNHLFYDLDCNKY